MKRFDKPATTIDEQIARLQNRGMEMASLENAAFYLGQISYYRLAAYWLPFESNHATHELKPGTTFEQVLDLYIFDRELRLLLLDAIERIEVAVRTRWSFEMAHRHGPHGYLDSDLAKSQQRWAENLGSLCTELKRSHELFIEDYRATSCIPDLPPVWMISEVMSFGALTRWYSQLGPMITRRAISGHFGLDQQQFEGVLEHITYLRNLCAHHSRVWNRYLIRTLPLPKNKPAGLKEQMNPGADKFIYNTLVLLLYLLDKISRPHHWRDRLLALLDNHPQVDLAAMGFPEQFGQLPIWQGKHQ